MPRSLFYMFACGETNFIAHRTEKMRHNDIIVPRVNEGQSRALAYWTKVVPKKRAFNRRTLSTRLPAVRMTKRSPMF